MNDLDLLRDLHAETPEPPADRLAPGRARLEAAYRGRTPRLSRPHWRVAVVATVTAVLVVPMTIVQTSGGPDRKVMPRTDATAAELEHAAAVAEANPDPVPEGDQFIYVETLQRSGPPAGPWKTYRNNLWYSVDGTRNGLYYEHGKKMSRGEPGAKIEEQPRGPGPFRSLKACGYPGYAKMPRDPKRLIAYLRAADPGAMGCSLGGPPDDLAEQLTSILAQPYLPAGLRPAAFRALATLNGLTVRKNVADASGRRGVGVVRVRPGEFGASEWITILDPRTYRFLGKLHTYVEDVGRDGVERGEKIVDWTAVTRTAIVDRPGRL